MDINTLCEQFCDYSSYARGYLPDTITRYRTVIRLFSRATNARNIHDCSEQVARRFFHEGSATRGWSPSTFRTYHKSLVVFFRWCVQHGYLASNPAEGLELPKLRRSIPRRLTSQECERLLERIANYPYRIPFERQRDLAIVATLLYAGLRRRELLTLQLRDVDPENHTLFVRLGKGAKDRIVPMHPLLGEILGRYLEDRRRVGKTCVEIVTSVHHDSGLTVNGLRRVFAKLQRITGMPLRPHILRHTFATLMLEGGCDIFALSRMMGHSDIKTTSIYLAATAQHLRAQMAKHPLT